MTDKKDSVDVNAVMKAAIAQMMSDFKFQDTEKIFTQCSKIYNAKYASDEDEEDDY